MDDTTVNDDVMKDTKNEEVNVAVDIEHGYGTQPDLDVTQEQQNNDRAYFGVQKKTSVWCCSFREIILIIAATILLTLIISAFASIGISSLVINAKCPQFDYAAFTVEGGSGDTIQEEYSLVNVTNIVIAGDIRTRYFVDDGLSDSIIVRVIRKSWSSSGYKDVKQTVSRFNTVNNGTVTAKQLVYRTRLPSNDFTDCVQVLQEVFFPRNLSQYSVAVRSYSRDIDFISDRGFVLGGLTVTGGVNNLNINNVTVDRQLIFTMTRGNVYLNGVNSFYIQGAATDGHIHVNDVSSEVTIIRTDEARISISGLNCMNGNLTTESGKGNQMISNVTNISTGDILAKTGAIYLALDQNTHSGQYVIRAGGSIKPEGPTDLLVSTSSTRKLMTGYIGVDDPTQVLSVRARDGNIRLYLNN